MNILTIILIIIEMGLVMSLFWVAYQMGKMSMKDQMEEEVKRLHKSSEEGFNTMLTTIGRHQRALNHLEKKYAEITAYPSPHFSESQQVLKKLDRIIKGEES